MGNPVTPAVGAESRSASAARRRIEERHQAALDEVDRILAAALRVVERVAPESPRVADIVAEARTSNQTFYRYFASKDDLMLAVLERGIDRVVAYLEHQMAKESTPGRQLARWIEGVLAQVTDPKAARESRATMGQLAQVSGPRIAEGAETVLPIRDLLIAPLERAGSADPARDADAVYEAVFGTVRRHLWQQTQPTKADVAHLVAFCLAGIDNGAPSGARSASAF